MAAPLSTISHNALHSAAPSKSSRYDDYEVRLSVEPHSESYDIALEQDGDTDDASSPFMSHVRDDQENTSPPKLRPASRVLSGTELSPLKILQDRRPDPPREGATSERQESPASSMPPPPLPKSPRKMTLPEKRFPIRVSTSPPSEATPRAGRTPSQEKHMSLEAVLRENEGLKHAIDIFEDEVSVIEDGERGEPESRTATLGADAHQKKKKEEEEEEELEEPEEQEVHEEDEPTGVDDTMISTFSNFSAVPNLTMLSRMRSNSPTRTSHVGFATPRARPDLSPMRTPRAAPAPRQSDGSGNTTSLLEFTEQLRMGAYYQSQSQSQSSPSRRENGQAPTTHASSSAAGAATPQRSHVVNLLDFDIPPLPTPRSIPTVTPRELESLKSGFLSEISSLKASLSGKEAEVSALKAAVGDAEKRVGECMEQLREARGQQEELAAERESWERRGREMEAVLRKVKEEIVLGQREREELEAKLDEADKRREAAEMMAQEAESKLAGMRAGKASAEAAAAAAAAGGAGGSSTPDRNGLRSPGGAAASNKEVEVAVERVARELHALYKSKHETKVAALKKSYEGRWEKKVRELEAQVEELARENEELRIGRDATMTHVDPELLRAREAEKEGEVQAQAARIRVLETEVQRLTAEVATVRGDNDELRGMLEVERVEKGELVLLAEELMSMQQSFVASGPTTGASAASSAAAPTPSRHNSHTGGRAGPVAATPGSSATAAAAAAATRSPASKQTSRYSMGPTTASGSSRMPASPARSTEMGPGSRASTGARISGLRAPGAGGGLPRPGGMNSQIGRVASHERTRSSGGSGVPRPGSGLGMRSGLMSSIEKMGSSYRGRNNE